MNASSIKNGICNGRLNIEYCTHDLISISFLRLNPRGHLIIYFFDSRYSSLSALGAPMYFVYLNVMRKATTAQTSQWR